MEANQQCGKQIHDRTCVDRKMSNDNQRNLHATFFSSGEYGGTTHMPGDGRRTARSGTSGEQY